MTKKCEYSEDLTCRVCGHVARSLPSHRVCRPPQKKELVVQHFELPTDPAFYGRPPWYFRWGDAVKAVLSALAITEERYAAFKRLFAKKKDAPQKKGCGCAARRERLNTAGYWTWRYLDSLRRRLGGKLTG